MCLLSAGHQLRVPGIGLYVAGGWQAVPGEKRGLQPHVSHPLCYGGGSKNIKRKLQRNLGSKLVRSYISLSIGQNKSHGN